MTHNRGHYVKPREERCAIFERQKLRNYTRLFRSRFLLLFLLLDASAAAGALHLRRLSVSWRGVVSRRVLLDVGNDAALIVRQLVDDSRHERPLIGVLLYTAIAPTGRQFRYRNCDSEIGLCVADNIIRTKDPGVGKCYKGNYKNCNV